MSYYPLVLSHQHVRRILERHATLLILGRRLPTGAREVHDAHVSRRNVRHVRAGRPELQEDPLVFTIEVEACTAMALDELPFPTIRRAGFQTTDEFLEDWNARRGAKAVEAFVHAFRVVEDARFLHERVHRGYTSNPGMAARGEPEALSRADVERLANRNRERFERDRRQSAATTPLPHRLSSLETAAASGDQQAKRHLFVIQQRLDAADRHLSRDAVMAGTISG